MNKKLEEILSTTKLNELLKKEEKRENGKKVALGILAAVGIAAVVAGIAYAVYRFFFAKDSLEDFEDEYDDDYDFLDDEDDDPVVEVTIKEGASAEKDPEKKDASAEKAEEQECSPEESEEKTAQEAEKEPEQEDTDKEAGEDSDSAE